MKTITIYLLNLILLGLTTSLYAQENGRFEKAAPIETAPAGGTLEKAPIFKKYRRRVLIMDFHNQQNKVDLDYLRVSIAEAFLGPLQKTSSFELQSRDMAAKSAGSRMTKDVPLSDEEAVNIGKSTASEVVVTGAFVVIDNKVQIQAKAIDVLSGRVSVSENVMSKLDSTLFENINALAEKMSAAMVRELPPVEQRTLVQEVILPTEQEKRVAKAEPMDHAVYASFALPFTTTLYANNGTVSIPDKLPLNQFSGWSMGLAYWNGSLLPCKIKIGSEFTFNSTTATANVVGTEGVILKRNETFSLRTFQLEAYAGYSLMRFMPFIKLSHLDIIGHAGAGIGQMSMSDTSSQTVMHGVYATIPVGLMSTYEIQKVYLGLVYRSGFIMLLDSHLYLGHRIDFRVGYQL